MRHYHSWKYQNSQEWREKQKKASREYLQTHKGYYAALAKNWSRKNRKKVNERERVAYHKRMKDPLYRIYVQEYNRQGYVRRNLQDE